MKSNESTQNNHDRGQISSDAAEVYESFFVPALFAPWPEHLLQRCDIQPGDRVLDVACGTGVLARMAMERVGPHGRVVGLDINPDMLAVAGQKHDAIAWELGAAESLPFADGYFDHVVSQFGLMFFDDPRRALREMVRVLKPNGSLAVAVWGSLSETPGYAAMAALLADLFGASVARSIEAPYVLGDRERLKALFAQADIEPIKFETVVEQARFASLDEWIHTDIRGWTLADVIDDESYARLRQNASTRLGRFVQADGSVAFDAPAHVVTLP